MSLIRNFGPKPIELNKIWQFTCPNCSYEQTIKTHLSKRLPGDKITTKEINTSVKCPNCEEKYNMLQPDEIKAYKWK